MCGGCAECASVSGELCGTRYAPLRPTVPLRYNRMLRKSIFCAVSVVSMEVWAVHVCMCVLFANSLHLYVILGYIIIIIIITNFRWLRHNHTAEAAASFGVV